MSISLWILIAFVLNFSIKILSYFWKVLCKISRDFFNKISLFYKYSCYYYRILGTWNKKNLQTYNRFSCFTSQHNTGWLKVFLLCYLIYCLYLKFFLWLCFRWKIWEQICFLLPKNQRTIHLIFVKVFYKMYKNKSVSIILPSICIFIIIFIHKTKWLAGILVHI